MAKSESFSLTGRARSIAVAWRGLVTVARGQHNAWIHAGATVAACGAGLVVGLSTGEWALVILAMAAVWAAEAFNTAVEALGDAVAPGDHPLVGMAKDAAAGGVLASVLGAVAVGLLVFVPRLVRALAQAG